MAGTALRVQHWGSRGAVCRPGARDLCPCQGSPGSPWPRFSRAVRPRGRKSADCLHRAALRRKQRGCWAGMSAWEPSRGGSEKAGSGPQGLSGGLCFPSSSWTSRRGARGLGARLGCKLPPLPVAVLLSSIPACPVQLGGRRRPRRTPGPASSARGSGTGG